MKVLFALTIALLFSLVSIAFCQDEDGPDVFPAERTRKLARELDLDKVKEVYILGRGETRVTDPKVVALIVEGLKTANTTNFSNQVDYIGVIGKDGNALINYGCSLSHFPEISPELAEGLKAAGAEPPGYTEWKQREKAQQETKRRLLRFAPPIALVLLLAFVIFKLKTRHRERTHR